MPGVDTKPEDPQIGTAPPNDPAIERYVLSVVMTQDGAYDMVSYLTTDVFYHAPHQAMWKAIEALAEDGAHPDMLAVTLKLRNMGNEDVDAVMVADIATIAASGRNLEHHSRLLQQMWMLRESNRLGWEFSIAARDPAADPFDLYEKHSAGLENIMANVVKDVTISLRELADDELANEDKPTKNAISTGFPGLDLKINGGYSPGDYWVVAARPAMGKTSFLVSSAVRSTRTTGMPMLVIQAELSRRAMNNRLYAADTGEMLSMLAARSQAPGILQRRHQHHEQYRTLPLWVNFNSGPSVADIRREVTLAKRKHDIQVCFIDQANWIVGKGDDKERLSTASRAMRRLCKDLEVTIVLLHQINRAAVQRGGDKRPSLVDLKGSGSFEEDPQVVLMLHRPEYYGIYEDAVGSTHGAMDIIIAKHSDGDIGDVRLRMDKQSASVHDDWSGPRPEPPVGAPHPDVTHDDKPF